MLFMIINTCEPGQRTDWIRRGIEKGPMLPEGMKLIGYWGVPGPQKAYMIVETNDSMKLFQLTETWGDISKMEIQGSKRRQYTKDD